MPEQDLVRFTDRLAEQVRLHHLNVGVDQWSSASEGSRTVNFVPANDAGASVTVTVFADDSVRVECGASVLRDSDFVSVGSDDYVRSPFATVVDYLEPWSSDPSA